MCIALQDIYVKQKRLDKKDTALKKGQKRQNSTLLRKYLPAVSSLLQNPTFTYETKSDLIEKMFGTQMQISTNPRVLLLVFQIKTFSKTQIFWGILRHAMEHLNLK